MRQPMRNRRRNLEKLAKSVAKGLRLQSDVLEVAQLLWERLDTPTSLGLSLLAKNQQLEEVVKVEFDPHRYLDDDWKTARDDYQAISFLRKFPLEISGVDRESVAREKFLASEQLCRKTNESFQASADRGFNPDVERVIHSSRRKIDRWLGKLDSRSWALRCRFGPGVDALNKGEHVSPYYKLSRPSVTPDFRDGALALVRSHPAWERLLLDPSQIEDFNPQDGDQEEPDFLGADARADQLRGILSVVPGNRVTFVPKSALTHRSIAIEPGMNIFAQLGLGALIRSRLKRHAGLDLDKQAPNQELACLGSRLGTVATIDLSSASDTIATEVVRLLLPPEWFTALDWCRSKTGTLTMNGENLTIRYEKFSSMGNGFTFELESMIFYAIALSVVELSDTDTSTVRAYGDDITVPTACVNALEKMLTSFGFIVNRQKSYSTGVFRESCGADFFNGKNVRPFFLKEYCESAPSLFRLANGIRRVAYRRNFGFGCDARLRPLWLHVVRRIPNSLRDLKIPFRPTLTRWSDVESGDGGLAVNHDEALSSPYVRFNADYMAGWLFAYLQARPSITKADSEQFGKLYLFALYACRDGTSAETTTYDQLVGRGESSRRLSTRGYTPGWFDLGPWALI